MTDARPFTRIWHSIWTDQDFTGLDSDAKVAYLLLISNGEARHTGLMTVAVNRWAAQAGMDTDRMLSALRALDAARFVVLDESTDELLVRSRMRNDTFIGYGWKTQKGALTGALHAVSPCIRSVLAYEITRSLPLMKPEAQAYADQVIAELEAAKDAGIDAHARGADVDPEILRSRDPEIGDPETHRSGRSRRSGRSTDPETSTSVALGRGSGGGDANGADSAIKSTEQRLRELYPDDDWDDR